MRPATASWPLILPYGAWMAMMTLLPATAAWYAARGVLTAVVLVFCLGRAGYANWPRVGAQRAARGFALGLGFGVAVFLVWIIPEALLGMGTAVSAAESPYAPEVCGWPLTVAKLAASAFVISAAEELFFRKWLVDFTGFGWMVVLFAAEHGDLTNWHRWVVGAVAGVAYGLLARREGLAAAIVAHAVTNLVLGLWVIWRGMWQFW